MEAKRLTLDWYRCSINRPKLGKRIPNSKVMDAVISSEAIKCLQKNGFNVEKIMSYDNSGNTKSINQA